MALTACAGLKLSASVLARGLRTAEAAEEAEAEEGAEGAEGAEAAEAAEVGLAPCGPASPLFLASLLFLASPLLRDVGGAGAASGSISTGVSAPKATPPFPDVRDSSSTCAARNSADGAMACVAPLRLGALLFGCAAGLEDPARAEAGCGAALRGPIVFDAPLGSATGLAGRLG